ncbi:MAG TPA: methyltransferase domain-containing protein [Chthoniobacterales bacterium]|nr:methyltransferase domain-containing protein [Chthoniobacterales bacterium]
MSDATSTKLSQRQAEELVRSVPAWHHRFEIAPGVVTPGSYDPNFLLEKLALPDDLSGQRILDIGPSDGFFSLHFRRRGAEVVAVDYRPKDMHGFGVMERISGLDFDYRQANVYDINERSFGTFSIVLFFGVLYHLPDMLKALWIVRSVCRGQMFLETHSANDLGSDQPVARYYRENTLNNDVSNFWSPNTRCVRDMLHDSAFDVERDEAFGDRYFAACRSNESHDRASKLRLAYSVISAVS